MDITDSMQRLYVYDGALIVIGISLGMESLLALKAGQSRIPLWLLAIGSSVIVIAALYEAITTDPDSYSGNTYVLFALVFAALLSLASAVIRLIG